MRVLRFLTTCFQFRKFRKFSIRFSNMSSNRKVSCYLLKIGPIKTDTVILFSESFGKIHELKRLFLNKNTFLSFGIFLQFFNFVFMIL